MMSPPPSANSTAVTELSRTRGPLEQPRDDGCHHVHPRANPLLVRHRHVSAYPRVELIRVPPQHLRPKRPPRIVAGNIHSAQQHFTNRALVRLAPRRLRVERPRNVRVGDRLAAVRHRRRHAPLPSIPGGVNRRLGSGRRLTHRPLAPLRILAALLVEHALRRLVALARRARLRLRRGLPPPLPGVAVVVIDAELFSFFRRHPGPHVLRVRLLLLPPRVRAPVVWVIVLVRRVERVHLVPGSNPGGAAAELVDLLAHRRFIAQFSAPLRLVQLLDRWTGSEALVFVGIAPAAGPGFAPRVELAHACRACFRGALRDGRRGLPGVVSRVRAGAGAGQASGDGDVVRGAVRGEVRGCIAASVRGCDVRAALDEPSREVVVAGDAREVQRGATVGVHRLDI
mmetsp:Transcript_12394/g.57354  ORF Transcript_12394/g.57354 Transcript_12394/m.57354 type:complete len:398 (+) Transcript_12394:61-1254(+)